MFSSSNNKRRSLFFGGSNNNSNSSINKENDASKKSTFKTFSVVHVNENEPSPIPQSRPADVVRRSSSQYKSKQYLEPTEKVPVTQQYRTLAPSTEQYRNLSPSTSMISKRPPPPTLDINSIYDTIQRHESQTANIASADEIDTQAQYNPSSDNTSSVYVGTPTTLKYPSKPLLSSFKEDFSDTHNESVADISYESGDSQGLAYEPLTTEADKGYNSFVRADSINEERSLDHAYHSESDSEDDMPSFTNSANFVENDTQLSTEPSGNDTPKNEEYGYNNHDDYIVSNNYTMKEPPSPNPGILNDLTKRHNRERSELEEYLEELEGFEIADAEDDDYTIQSYQNRSTTTESAPKSVSKRDSLDSDVSSIVFETTGGLKVVNAESDSEEQLSDASDNESISADEDSTSDSSSFLEKHSQLSAVKSLYHSDDAGAWVEQGSVPSLPFTIDNHNNTYDNREVSNDQSINESFDIAPQNSMPTMSSDRSNFMDNISGEPNMLDQKSIRTGQSSIHFVPPESKYISRLLNKHPTSNKKNFKFEIPLNLLSNPAEDPKSKTAVLKNPRKSKNIKHKTAKKKLLSNEEPTPKELLKTKTSGFGMHSNVKDGNHRLSVMGLGDIDEEERLILQQLPGSEGYLENSLASNNHLNGQEKNRISAQTRARSDTIKSYYTRNVNRLRTETISTIDTMNNVNMEGLQITNPDSD